MTRRLMPPMPPFVIALLMLATAMSGHAVAQGPVVLKHESIVSKVVFSPDGKALATISQGKVTLWDVATAKQKSSFLASNGVPKENPYRFQGVMNEKTVLMSASGQLSMDLAFSPDGKTLATAVEGKGQGVKLWETATAKEVLSIPKTENVRSLAFSPDGKTLALGDLDGVSLWDASVWKARGSLTAPAKPGLTYVPTNCLVYSPDGAILAAGCFENVVLWNNTGKEMARLDLKSNLGRNLAFSLCFSPNGKTLVCGSEAALPGAAKAENIKLFDPGQAREQANLSGHLNYVFAVAFSPDGKLLASASADKTIRLWDVAARKELAVLKDHADSVNCVVFSPDGKTLASAASDRTVRLWEVSKLLK
jgi:WD40 repeat protein